MTRHATPSLREQLRVYAESYVRDTGKRPTMKHACTALGMPPHSGDAMARRAGFIDLFEINKRGAQPRQMPTERYRRKLEAAQVLARAAKETRP